LQVLRRSRRSDRPQGYPPPAQLRLGARQDHPAPYLRQLRPASAAAHPRRPPRSHRRAPGPNLGV